MIFYIAYTGFEISEASGIWKKIMGQTRAFERSLDKTYYTLLNCQIAYLMDGRRIVEKVVAATRQDYLKILIQWIEKYEVKKTYIRYPFADKWFIELLRYQKKQGIQTVLEIASYPYDGELSYGRLKVEDAYYRKMVSEYVDLITTYTRYETIWGKPCITLVNGVDLEEVPLKKQRRQDGKLVLAAVSCMQFWHAFDRMLEGMHQYYQAGGTKDIVFKLIGEGQSLNNYKKMAESYDLMEHVVFCGKLKGEELTKVYDEADVAVGSLGIHRMGNLESAPIKGAEYCARGLPMVFGYTDTRFQGGIPFVLQVPADDTPVSVNEIIKFYEELDLKQIDSRHIRDFAQKNLTWDAVMQPVVKYYVTNKI